MDGDRHPSRPSNASGHGSTGRPYVSHARAEATLLGAGGDRRSKGVAYPGTTPPARAAGSEASPLTSDHADVNPPELRNLLDPVDAAGREAAWDVFVARHSRLLLHVARKVMPESDVAMDAYAHLLERLRRDDCRVLTTYCPDGRSRFTTWLVVVAGRMCVDFYRQKNGRPRGASPTQLELVEREARHRLATFTGIDGALAHLVDDRGAAPDTALRNGQLVAALDAAVAALSPDDQLLLKLRFHDEVPVQRIAKVLSLPSPFHVYRRLKAVCAELRRRLVARGVEDGSP